MAEQNKGFAGLLGNVFGTAPPAYMEGLLGQQATEDLRKRSIGTGIANALIGYAGMPKNQNLGLGRILAGAAQAGIGGARGVYQNATQDYVQGLSIEEAKRKQDRQRELESMISGIADPNERRLALISPEKYVQNKLNPESPFAKFDVTAFTRESVAAYQQSQNPADLVALNEEKKAALPWYVRIDEQGKYKIDPEFSELERIKASTGRAPSMPKTPVAYIDPVTGKTVWGTILEAMGKEAANYSAGVQGSIAQAKAQGGVVGKGAGDNVVTLDNAKIALPNLRKVADDLHLLGQRATYTKVGQFVDSAQRQLGMDVGDGAVARVEYIAKVDNEVLPLLRQTFGAAFTAAEGQQLKVTLGDPDKSPAEKDAVLRAFIDAKVAQIEALEGSTTPIGTPPPEKPKTASMQDIQDTAIATGKSTAQVTADLKALGYTIGK